MSRDDLLPILVGDTTALADALVSVVTETLSRLSTIDPRDQHL